MVGRERKCNTSELASSPLHEIKSLSTVGKSERAVPSRGCYLLSFHWKRVGEQEMCRVWLDCHRSLKDCTQLLFQRCHGFSPASGSPSLTPPQQDQGENGKVKDGELLAWDKGSLIGNINVLCKSKVKQGITTSRGQAGVQHLRGAGSHTWNSYLGRKTKSITPDIPHFLLLPSTSYTEHDVMWSGVSLGAPCPSWVPSQAAPISSPAWPYKQQKRLCLCVSPAQ